ncbi:MAG: potassium-transporting ATPase subunit KdpC [Byssovorax sp.]
MKTLRPCLVITAILLLLCCGLYPAVVIAASSALFSEKAEGSLIVKDGRVVGSSLLGQTFDKPEAHPEYFWGRPSAASIDSATGVLVSGGSNYGPLNPALKDEVAARIALLRATGVTGPIPVDLVTRSGSGLDPHVSIAAARIQIPRVATARGMTEDGVLALVALHTEAPTLGILGDPRVNVLELNLALDAARPLSR